MPLWSLTEGQVTRFPWGTLISKAWPLPVWMTPWDSFWAAWVAPANESLRGAGWLALWRPSSHHFLSPCGSYQLHKEAHFGKWASQHISVFLYGCFIKVETSRSRERLWYRTCPAGAEDRWQNAPREAEGDFQAQFHMSVSWAKAQDDE